MKIYRSIRMTFIFSVTIFVLFVTTQEIFGWESLPQIPSGRRSQFFVLDNDGSYKYGYDTGDGSAAKQSADSSNQVEGHYFYKDHSGKDIDLKYTAGVQGFVSEGLEKFQAGVNSNHPSYKFEYAAPQQSRSEESNSNGNIRGSYAYVNNAGYHDLNYIAGANTGFRTTGGSLATPNGLGASLLKKTNVISSLPSHITQSLPSNDGSYAFTYSTENQVRQEESHASGNIQRGSSYKNVAGPHDLSYVAGAKTGFQLTGESLASYSRLPHYLPTTLQSGNNYYTGKSAITLPSIQGAAYSYLLDYSKDNRQSDANNIQARYSYTIDHGANYVSGPIIGYNLSNESDRSKIIESPTIFYSKIQSSSTDGSHSATRDASYNFTIDTDDYKRTESSDSQGNVQGKFSYRNSAGINDLSYLAGSGTGFVATGGSLSVPNGILGRPETAQSLPITSSNIKSSTNDGNKAYTGDASYDFTIDTDDYKRTESSDSQGNVQGNLSYRNYAGIHDLSYLAGSGTGFVTTGGSLSVPNGILGRPETDQSVSIASSNIQSSTNDENEAYTGDASYNFTIDTDAYKRTESSDSQGNVQGSFSYRNSAGTNELTYIAGSGTGFMATGGSLSIPNGLLDRPVITQSSPIIAKEEAEVTDTPGNDRENDRSENVNNEAGLSADLTTTDESSSGPNGLDEPEVIQSSSSVIPEQTESQNVNQDGGDGLENINGEANVDDQANPSNSIRTDEEADPDVKASPKDEANTDANIDVEVNTDGQADTYDQADIDEQANSGDASYKFTIDTDEYKRSESADARGNVEGIFSYQNSEGSHDLRYTAGSNTGFVATSGSLKTPPGLSESQIQIGILKKNYLPPVIYEQQPEIPYRQENIIVHTYLPPSDDKEKYGCILDTKYY